MYLISDMAKKSGLSTDTIRFYEKKGFIQPNFRANNQYRFYNDETLKRLIFMKHCRALDMSLKEIENLLQLEENPQQNCNSVNHLIDQHISDITNKMKELDQLKKQLKKLRSRCLDASTVDQCQILKTLESDSDFA